MARGSLGRQQYTVMFNHPGLDSSRAQCKCRRCVWRSSLRLKCLKLKNADAEPGNRVITWILTHPLVRGHRLARQCLPPPPHSPRLYCLQQDACMSSQMPLPMSGDKYQCHEDRSI